MSLDAINEALAQARAGAAAAVPAAPAAPMVGGGAVALAPQVQGGRAVSMREALSESSMSVKAYLKVKPHGFLIGDDTKTVFEEIQVEFKFSDAKAFYGVRYGNPAKYERSFDRIVNARTKRPWDQCVAEAMRQDSRCRGDYRGLDLPFTVMEDLKDKKGEKTLIEAGEAIGWTSAVTNWKDWAKFAEPFYKLMDAGTITEDCVVRGKIVHEQRKDANNEWGAVTFVDFAIVSSGYAQPEAAAAE